MYLTNLRSTSFVVAVLTFFLNYNNLSSIVCRVFFSSLSSSSSLFLLGIVILSWMEVELVYVIMVGSRDYVRT